MYEAFWKAALSVGGIGTIALFVFWDILGKVIERNQSDIIIISCLLVLLFIVNKVLNKPLVPPGPGPEKQPLETTTENPTSTTYPEKIKPAVNKPDPRGPTSFEPLHLFGRKKETDRLVTQILTGQSIAIRGVFEQERTTLLGYLSDPSHSQTLYGEYADKLVFSSVDVSADLPKDGSPADFWQRALRPLEDKCQESSTLLKLYQSCSQNQFDEYCLDKLIVQLKQEGGRLVLMLDRFDELLRSPNFKENGKFFATLRKLASSRSPSSLCLIISWGLSLKEFHEETRILSKGSPYFNFMGEVVLVTLSDPEIDKVLSKDFSEAERRFLKDLTGRHPYFLQLAVSALQTAKGRNEKEPLESARKDFAEGVANILANLIHAWEPKVGKALVSLVKEGKAPELSNEEMSLLEKQGVVIMRDRNNQWQISPRVWVDFINSKTEQELCNQ